MDPLEASKPSNQFAGKEEGYSVEIPEAGIHLQTSGQRNGSGWAWPAPSEMPHWPPLNRIEGQNYGGRGE